MLTKTSLSALRALMYLSLYGQGEPISPRRAAQALGESPTYLAKVVRQLVKAGLLRAHRGTSGGVVLNRPAEQITLLAVVEACQGAILGDFCTSTDRFDPAETCALHQAGTELYDAIVGVLSRWTLAHFLRGPGPSGRLVGHVRCRLGWCPRVPVPPDASLPAPRAPQRKTPPSNPPTRQAKGRGA